MSFARDIDIGKPTVVDNELILLALEVIAGETVGNDRESS